MGGSTVIGIPWAARLLMIPVDASLEQALQARRDLHLIWRADRFVEGSRLRSMCDEMSRLVDAAFDVFVARDSMVSVPDLRPGELLDPESQGALAS
ncbi:MAG: hypothetical protein IT203_00455 [Fimbriimonadaceae bacterium]|nr:hypothetical protein [Fimbriimonadaceae bacterium]